MALKITRPDGRTITEPIGGALLEFVDGAARVTGYVSQLRPSLIAALRRRGWTATNVRQRHTAPPAPADTAQPAPPAPEPAPEPATDDDHDDDPTPPRDFPLAA